MNCQVCGKEAKRKSRNVFRKTCGDDECMRKLRHVPHTAESKEKLRAARLRYMENNPESTAWRQRATKSWPEKFFMDGVRRAKLDSKFEIVTELSIFPYYVDFAFMQIKVAVEVDGSQHELQDRKARDDSKDELLISKGWRVYRISANKLYSLESTDEVIQDLIQFIGATESFKDCGIKSAKEKRDEVQSAIDNEKLSMKQKEILEIKSKILESEIDLTKFGWVQKVAPILEIEPQKVRGWMKRNLPELEEISFRNKR